MEISRLSPIESHQGVVAIAEGKAGVELEEFLLHLDALSEPALVLLIDSLQDPQNFGVLLRSAEAPASTASSFRSIAPSASRPRSRRRAPARAST